MFVSSQRKSVSCCIIGLAIVLLLPYDCWALQCYRCSKAKSNEDCNKEEHLIDCAASGSAAADACKTLLHYKKGEGLTITKGCALRPCSLAHKGVKDLLKDDCDPNDGDEWDCLRCCLEDGCNKSGARADRPKSVVLIISVVITTVLAIYRTN